MKTLGRIVLPYESSDRLRFLINGSAGMADFSLPRDDAEELVRVAEQVVEEAKQQLAMKTCPYCNQMTGFKDIRFWHAMDESENCLKCNKCGSLVREDGSKLRDISKLR